MRISRKEPHQVFRVCLLLFHTKVNKEKKENTLAHIYALIALRAAPVQRGVAFVTRGGEQFSAQGLYSLAGNVLGAACWRWAGSEAEMCPATDMTLTIVQLATFQPCKNQKFLHPTPPPPPPSLSIQGQARGSVTAEDQLCVHTHFLSNKISPEAQFLELLMMGISNNSPLNLTSFLLAGMDYYTS